MAVSPGPNRRPHGGGPLNISLGRRRSPPARVCCIQTHRRTDFPHLWRERGQDRHGAGLKPTCLPLPPDPLQRNRRERVFRPPPDGRLPLPHKPGRLPGQKELGADGITPERWGGFLRLPPSPWPRPAQPPLKRRESHSPVRWLSARPDAKIARASGGLRPRRQGPLSAL